MFKRDVLIFKQWEQMESFSCTSKLTEIVESNIELLIVGRTFPLYIFLKCVLSSGLLQAACGGIN